MLSWIDVEVRQMEHAQRIQRLERTYLMQAELASIANIDRWQWRLMLKLGDWLVMSGSRLQAHVETTRRVVHTSSLAAETNSQSTQPCP